MWFYTDSKNTVIAARFVKISRGIAHEKVTTKLTKSDYKLIRNLILIRKWLLWKILLLRCSTNIRPSLPTLLDILHTTLVLEPP